MNIGQAVRQARKGCGLTQEELAKRASISRSAIVKLEINRGSCSTLKKVRPHIGFRITALAAGNEPAEQVRNARSRRGYSLEKVAKGAGVSIPTVRLIEAGGGTIASLSAIIQFLAPKARANGWYRAHWQVRKDVRFTPPQLIETIVEILGPIDLDPAGDERSFVNARKTITENEDGLSSRWSGHLVFVNPPFSELSRWMHRCCDAWSNSEIEQMLALFPARTETVAYRQRIFGVADTLLLPRRMRFFNDNREELPPSPFALMLCSWGIEKDKVAELAEALEANVVWSERHK
jgi:transcriptional regulator with XRE-family HTH domain